MQELSRELYRKMFLIRRAEEVICQYYNENDMKTPMHMSMGGEAISVGVCHALNKEDQIVGTYRSHGIYLAKTEETDAFFAEMYGKVGGTSKGKSGSMHLMDANNGLICTSAIVGSSIPVAVGAAYANKYKKNGKIVSVFFGDGAIDEGVFWESVNAACLMKLPVMFVCEDNGFAVHVPKGERHGYKSVSDIISKFDCAVYSDETTDVEKIYQLTQKAIQEMREFHRPAFLHLKYYRYLEHVGVFDDFKSGYRPRDDYEQWLKVDPLKIQRQRLLGAIGETELEKIEGAIDQQVRKSLQLAKEQQFPDKKEIFEDLYV